MSVDSQTIKEIRGHLKTQLRDIYPDNEINAIINLIFKTLFGYDRLHSLINPDLVPPSDIRLRITEIEKELKTGKPIQYILGETLFFDCKIKVNKATLIPRPETEELVDLIIKENRGFKGRILDIGTGSGCIAVSLKKNLKLSEVTGIDISEEALEVARTNALLNETNVSFMNLDVFQPDKANIQAFDLIVGNPPYVLESEKLFMKGNVLDFEPHNALFVPDSDPLVFYRAIISFSEKMLTPGGKIYLEINEKKGENVLHLFELSGYKETKIITDLFGKNRFVRGEKMADNLLFEISLKKTMSLCAGREYCYSDIRQKLSAWNVPDDDAEKILKILTEGKFIDESRYAIAFSKDKFRYNKWGKLKIGSALKMKRIPTDIISIGLNSIDDTEYLDLLKAIIEKQKKIVKAKSQYELKGKILRHVLSRGFESHLVYDLLKVED